MSWALPRLHCAKDCNQSLPAGESGPSKDCSPRRREACLFPGLLPGCTELGAWWSPWCLPCRQGAHDSVPPSTFVLSTD